MSAEEIATPPSCRIHGPYYPVGVVDWECRTHGVDAELRDPSKQEPHRRADFYCPIGEPDAAPTRRPSMSSAIEQAAIVAADKALADYTGEPVGTFLDAHAPFVARAVVDSLARNTDISDAEAMEAAELDAANETPINVRDLFARHTAALTANAAAEVERLDTELRKVNDELERAGIAHPLGHRGVHDLASMAVGRLEDLRTAEQQVAALTAENERLRGQAERWMESYTSVREAGHEELTKRKAAEATVAAQAAVLDKVRALKRRLQQASGENGYDIARRDCARELTAILDAAPEGDAS